jgi:hypothetical protein
MGNTAHMSYNSSPARPANVVGWWTAQCTPSRSSGTASGPVPHRPQETPEIGAPASSLLLPPPPAGYTQLSDSPISRGFLSPVSHHKLHAESMYGVVEIFVLISACRCIYICMGTYVYYCLGWQLQLQSNYHLHLQLALVLMVRAAPVLLHRAPSAFGASEGSQRGAKRCST